MDYTSKLAYINKMMSKNNVNGSNSNKNGITFDKGNNDELIEMDNSKKIVMFDENRQILAD